MDGRLRRTGVSVKVRDKKCFHIINRENYGNQADGGGKAKVAVSACVRASRKLLTRYGTRLCWSQWGKYGKVNTRLLIL